MNDQQKQFIDQLQKAKNVLVTVSQNPSIDQLAAAIGLTLALNKLDKHATAVYSGETPSVLEFLKPEETLEDDTNSLRDFIIALDKSKADKLRYKVEDEVVRIFITPYRTSISQNDLEFSQGDFNVDLVIALGVKNPQDLDSAVQAHGRILHDAVVVSVSKEAGSELGTLQWSDPQASSLSEMITVALEGMHKKIFDNQIATALLTGIVATTDRFSNELTTPETMSLSSVLMAAGANQQLIASELDTPEGAERPDAPEGSTQEQASEPGELDIDHDESDDDDESPDVEPAPEQPKGPQIEVNENGEISGLSDEDEDDAILPAVDQPDEPKVQQDGPKRELLGPDPHVDEHQASAMAEDDAYDPTVEELTHPAGQHDEPLLSHENSTIITDKQGHKILQPLPTQVQEETPPTWTPAPTVQPPVFMPPAPAADIATPVTPPAAVPAPTVEQRVYTAQPVSAAVPPKPADSAFAPYIDSAPPTTVTTRPKTLAELEAEVHSSHLQPATPTSEPAPSLEDARNAVQAALSTQDVAGPVPEPITALNAQPLGEPLHTESAPATGLTLPSVEASNPAFAEPTPGLSPADATLDMPMPQAQPAPSATPPPFFGAPAPAQPAQPVNPASPPPVPPPFVPPLN